MTTLLQEAVDNNVAWCARVCRSHGVLGQYGDGWWVTLSAAPTYYPDAMTLRPEASLETLPRMAIERAGASVKDSFDAVDLPGLEVAIEASWIGYERPSAELDPGWSVVRTPDQLAAWRVAHGDAPSIHPDLLADLDVRVLAAFVDEAAVAGLIAYRTGDVVGVSNVFLGGGHGWDAAVAAVSGCFPGLPLVGWESEAMLHSAVAAGFIALGPLRVWFRTPA
ncbi:hypothetical protein acdb102_01090 [Acidothermaceae bacterium B102]|nr:hypothetical protein acdb102_01090 [Acidothermaceae bacterium B102]